MSKEVKPRYIDTIPSETPHPREMEVLSLGLSRTATMSMHLALTKLGHKVYHFKEVGQRDLPGELPHGLAWREAFAAKMYGNGKPFGKPEFDKLLKRYSAVTDAPCCCFADELVAAYPKAKVILSTRDPDKWVASMENAYYALLTSPRWKYFRALCMIDTEFLGPFLDLLRFPVRMWTGDDWENREKLRQGFLDHNAHVREIVPKENLLEWVPSDGWVPICEFLGVPVPDEPFPNINKGSEVQNMFVPLAAIRFWSLFWKQLLFFVFTFVGLLWGICRK